jgi:LCP family protein required for cell wall assembly
MAIYQSKHALKKRSWRIYALVGGLSLALLAGLAVAGVWAYTRSLNGNLDRVDALTGAPAAAEKGPMNLLVVGTDSREPDGEGRTDTIMLAHVTKERDHVYLSSIARDTWVPIPGHGEAKINAAYPFGGAPLLVETVQQYTGVTIDHFVMIDFAGFESVVDSLGGVDMTVEQTFKSIHAPYRTFTKGAQHFTGAEALDYVRQRKQFADGDFTRQKHQQQLISAVIDRATSTGILTDPGALNGFLQSTTSAITVDRDFDLTKTAFALRDLRSSAMTYLTSPNKGTGTVGKESVVLPDPVGAAQLYSAYTSDTVADYLSSEPGRLP